MLNVYYFVYNLGGYSGAAQQAYNLAAHIPENITIFNIGSAYNGVSSNNVNIINLHNSSALRYLHLVYQFISQRPDLIHFHGQFLIPMLLAKLLGIRFILKTTLLGDDDFDSIAKKKYSKLRLWLSLQCRYNIVLSSHLKNLNKKHLTHHKVHIIPNGTQIPITPPAFDEKQNHFYFCGVISKRKNTLRAIEIFHKEFAHLPSARFFIIGPDTHYSFSREFDESYVTECRNFVSENGLFDKVEFTGHLPQTKVKAIARKCKALLFFSEFEGMPNVVIEAMAQNCVPLISSMHGVGEELTKDNAGFVCEHSNIPKISTIDALIKEMRPYLRAKSTYSLEATAEKVKKLYLLASV